MLRTACCTILACALGSPAVAVPPAARLVDDFNDGVQNHFSGYRNPFAAAPSSASATRVAEVHRGATGRSVKIDAQRKADGFCGYWIHLFDMRGGDAKEYFDARDFAFLSFWVKGEAGGEDFLVKLADKKWTEKQDAIPIGAVRRFLPGGVTNQWQEVLIPLVPDPRLDWAELGGITFEFDRPGDYVVYLDDISFKRSRRAPSPMAATVETPAARGKHTRKLWVWSTDTLLGTPSARDRLFQFCRQQNIDEIWMQLLYDLDLRRGDDGSPAASLCTLRHEQQLQQLLQEAHSSGVRVHALDGYPEYCQQAYHHIPLAVVDAVIDFNRRHEPPARFAGVHFDNEPYLLIGWQAPLRREQILEEFLQLNVECQRRIRASSDMEFGVDIPFWWQEPDEKTGQILGEVQFNGKRQAASFHCIELLDNVGVMNYRDTTDGADGMIAHGRDLLAFADQHGGARIYMGVETFRYENTAVWFAMGLPRAQFLGALHGPARQLADLSRLNEFRLRTLDDGQRVHVGIELPGAKDDPRQAAAFRSLVQLAEQLGATAADSTVAWRQPVQERIEQDAEWTGYRARNIYDPFSGRRYPGFMAESIMLEKTTFADEPLEHLNAQIRAADDYFSRYQSYRGIAVHYYQTFRDKVAEAGAANAGTD